MEPNESLFGRIIRSIVGVILLAVVFFSLEGPIAIVEGAIALIVGVVGAIVLLTGLIGWCPAYALLGIDMCPPRRPARQ